MAQKHLELGSSKSYNRLLYKYLIEDMTTPAVRNGDIQQVGKIALPILHNNFDNWSSNTLMS